jgi:hypothetical protein
MPPCHDHPDTMTIEPSREERVAEMAAQKALAAYTAAHPCRFNDRSAKILHTISDEDGGLDVETVTMLIRAAKILNGAINTVARGMVLGAFVALLIVLSLIARRQGWKIF